MPDIKKNWIVVAQADGEHKPGEQTGAHEGAGAGDAGHGTGETHATVGHESGGHGGEHGSANPLTHHSPFDFSISGLVVAGVLLALSIAATAKMAKIPRNKLQTIMESVVEFINNFCEQNIGPGGRKFAPLIGTLFLFILFSNLLGALPLIFKAEGTQVGPYFNFLIGPTANLSMNFAMALIVFFTFQFVALKEQGFVGRLKHLWGPVPFAGPLIFVLEVISELIRPISLSFRLFGNIFGEEMMVAAIIGLVAMLPVPFGWLPLHLPLLLFGLLTAVVQAGVFCLLSCIYLRMAQAHDDHGSHGHDEAHEEHGEHAHPAPAH